MEEFAKMIYEQWRNSDESEKLSWGQEYDDAWKKVYDILNPELASDIEGSINKLVWNIQENAFMAGFGYACKCLSNGKIELGGAKL